MIKFLSGTKTRPNTTPRQINRHRSQPIRKELYDTLLEQNKSSKRKHKGFIEVNLTAKKPRTNK